MNVNFTINLVTIIAFSISAQALDSVETVAALSCSFENKPVTADLRLVANGYRLKIKSDNAFFPSVQYEAKSIKASSTLFVFKGSPKKSGELSIDFVVIEKNNPGKLCGAVQLVDLSGIAIGATLGCCRYVKKPSNEINFEIGQ